ncbi:MAG: LamG-like jellyroll fold domain-containing protein [Saprospiraceae bacterium]
MKKTIIQTLLILLSLSPFYSQVVLEGTIAKYYFNESNANDEIGTKDGVLFGAAPSGDRFGNEEHAFDFNNAFIRIDHDENLDLGTNEFSISAWFKTENNDSYGAIFNKGEGSASRPRIFIRTMADPINTIQWRVGNGVTNVTETYTDPSLFDNEWHHVVLVRNTNDLSMYVDATLVDFTSDSQLPFINTNSNRPILIGVQDSILSSNVPLGNFFDGELDDYRIYNRAIDNLEVDSLYNEGNPVVSSIATVEASKIRVAPNPSFDNIQVELPSGINRNTEFDIINSLGAIVKSGNLENAIINLTSLSAGIYYLRISNQETVLGIEKILKLDK